MKNVYTILLLLCALVTGAQELQNARWYFGQWAGLKFTTSSVADLPDMPTTSSFYTAGTVIKGCATVSNINGQLLFYTNGVKVYCANHTEMPQNPNTELQGSTGSAQNSIIVPFPGNTNLYYIITIDGYNGNSKGLYYYVVDMTQNSGWGKVISRTVLKDENGTDLNSTYNYGTFYAKEKLTATYAADGVNYWVVTQVKNKIYSYKVTANGIGEAAMPSNISATFVDTGASAGLAIKISPDASRIATDINNSSIPTDAFRTGYFDNTDGSVYFATTVKKTASAQILGSFEFSPNSNIFYYVLTTTNSSGSISHGVYKNNTFSGTGTLIGSVLGVSWGAMQRAIDGKIYMSKLFSNDLSIINDPDNFTTPNYVVDGFTMSRTNYLGLPQLVPYHEVCTSLTLESEENTVPFVYSNKSDITTVTDYVTEPGYNITMKAKDFVLLQPNTHIKAGSNYLAQIETCNYGSEYVYVVKPANATAGQETNTATTTSKAALTLYPNPANNVLNIVSQNGIQQLTIMGLDGKIVYTQHLPDAPTETTINVSPYATGYYMVNVVTKTGEIMLQKLVKN